MTIDNGLSTVDVRDTIPTTFIGEDGLPYYVKHVNDKPRVSAMEYLYDIAEGNVPGMEAWSKIGFNGDVDAGTGGHDSLRKEGKRGPRQRSRWISSLLVLRRAYSNPYWG